MITINTAPIDAYGHGRVYQIAEHVYRDADTGAVFITDGEQTIVVRVTTTLADQE